MDKSNFKIALRLAYSKRKPSDPDIDLSRYLRVEFAYEWYDYMNGQFIGLDYDIYPTKSCS